MSRETLAMLLTTLLFSIFFGFHGRDDRWRLRPIAALATASVLCACYNRIITESGEPGGRSGAWR